MKSPELSPRPRAAPVSLSFLVVLCLLLLSSVSASPPLSASRPPPRSPSTGQVAPTAVHSVTSSARSVFTSTTRPVRPASTAPPTPIPSPTASSTNALPFVPSSWTSSSHSTSDSTMYGSRMSLARMLSLVFVSLLFIILVISLVWYWWRRQWLAQRQHQTQPLSDDGWLRVDEKGQVVRDDAVHQPTQPYQPSMLSYMTPSPTPAALTISYQPYVDVNSERQYVRF